MNQTTGLLTMLLAAALLTPFGMQDVSSTPEATSQTLAAGASFLSWDQLVPQASSEQSLTGAQQPSWVERVLGSPPQAGSACCIDRCGRDRDCDASCGAKGAGVCIRRNSCCNECACLF